MRAATTPPLKVFYLITELGAGGAQTALVELVTRLDRQRFDPQVACFYNGDSHLAQRLRERDIAVIDLGLQGVPRPAGLLRLVRLLRAARPDLLHAWMFHANLAGRIAGRLAGVPAIITSRRNVEIGGPGRERLNRWTSFLDDHVIAVCEAARQLEIERAGLPPEKVTRIYNGIDADGSQESDPSSSAAIRRQLRIPPGVFLAGSAGRLHPQKGQARLIEALGQLAPRHERVHLLIAGEGELRPALEAQAAAAGRQGQVTFAGLRSDLPALLPALDLFVLPSLWEGLPNALLEAMAAGLPVVATHAGGVPEVIEHGVTGLLVPPNESQALAAAITRLVDSPALRRRLAAAGQRHVLEHFDIVDTVAQTTAVYEQVLASRQRRRNAG